MPKVLIVEGPQKGRSFDLGPGPNVVGRGDDAHITLPSGQVSRRHASFVFAEGRVYVEDMGSSNGTYVNGARVQKVEIRKGNLIRVGEFTMQVVPDSHVGAAPPKGDAGPPAGAQPPQEKKSRGRRGRGKRQRPAAQPPRAKRAPAGRSPGAFKSSGGSSPDSRFWKLYAPLRVVPWQVQIALVMFLLSGVILFSVVAPSLSQAEDDVSAEALKRAATLVNALAMKNGEFIKTRNDIYYDTQSFLQNEGVSEAYLLNRDLVILSPPTQRNRVKRNALTNQVQNSREVVSLEETEVEAEGRPGTYHLATPIRVWNTESGRYDIFGYAYLVFRADQVGEAATGRTSRMGFYGFVIMTMTIAALILIIMLTSKPITALRDDAELALRGDIASVQSRARFKALEGMAHTFNRALEKGNTGPVGGEIMGGMGMPVAADMPAAAPMAAAPATDSLGDKKVEAIANAVGQGVLILDDMQRVVHLNRQMERYIGRSSSGLEGKHVMEVVSDPQVLGTVLDLFKQIMTSPGSLASQPVDIRGEAVNVVVSGVVSSNQELKYAAVVIG